MHVDDRQNGSNANLSNVIHVNYNNNLYVRANDNLNFNVKIHKILIE